jgi:4-amino-4-deoxy-L-arabinose transferase-like glycosyltransferase
LLILLALVALARLPFLDEAVQGDDVYYLLIAENARVDPWHPMQMGFRLQGEAVWAAGHTRPPGNAYLLAALLGVFGGMRETGFHAVYAAFSLLALIGCYFLARRFTDRPLVAALCVAVAPPFLVNGNKLESDLPMLAFLAAGAALLVHRRFAGAALGLALAAFFGYQALFLLPVFALWVWIEARSSVMAWAALGLGPALLIVWQLAERAASGSAPAENLAGYFSAYGLLALTRKARSVQALQAHLGMLVSPLILAPAFVRVAKMELVAAALLALAQAFLLEGYSLGERVFFWVAASIGLTFLLFAARKSIRAPVRAEAIPALWIVSFFLAAIAVFYAGSARYLLPLLPAAGIVVANLRVGRAWLSAGLAASFLLGMALAASEYQHAGAYRSIANEVQTAARGRRVWSNAEWGLRYYLGERAGSDPLLAQQAVPGGAVVVESALAATIPYRVEGSRRELMKQEIAVRTPPFRTIGPGSHAGYSSSEFGVLPFGIRPGLLDTVTVFEVGRPEPTLSYLKMNDPKADEHLLGGFFPSDGAEWRWMGPEGAALLIAPPGASALEVNFHIPEDAPARHVEVDLDGETIASQDYETTGGFVLRAPVEAEPGAAVRLTIRASPSYTPPGDGRELAIVMTGFGFVTD